MRHLADGLASLANPIGGPVDKVRVGLFRLKSLVGDTYAALQAPETSTMRQLQVTALPLPPPPAPCAMCSLTSAPSDCQCPHRLLLVRGSCFDMHNRVCPSPTVFCWCGCSLQHEAMWGLRHPTGCQPACCRHQRDMRMAESFCTARRHAKDRGSSGADLRGPCAQ